MRKLLIASCILIAGVIGLVWLARFAKRVVNVPREAYAADWIAVFLIEHLRASESWPAGWEDLRDEYDRLAVPEFYAWTFAELQELIDVNWNVEIDDVRNSPIPLDLIQLTSGGNVSYGGDPDVLVHDYLRKGTITCDVPREKFGG